MTPRRLTSLALCATVLLVAAAVGRGSGSSADRPPTQGPNSVTQPLVDGCARTGQTQILMHDVPNWVYVGGDPQAAQQKRAAGLITSRYESELAAHPTGIDDPKTHTSYDFVFNLEPDAVHEGVLGTANFEGRAAETGRLHTEREMGTFPVFAWPDRGDRVSIVGSWVWDCDHTGPSGERTEIHPHRILWVERNPGGASPRSAVGDREADLFVTNASTPADTQAVCASRTKGDRPAFKQCVATPAGRLSLAAADFSLKASPRPSKKARLVYRVVDRGSTVPVRITRVAGGVTVHVESYGPERAVVIAKQIFVGWRPVPRRARPVHLRVRLQALLVRAAMDPSCGTAPRCSADDVSTRLGQLSGAPDEWNVYVNAAGVWAPWRPILLRPVRGQTIRGRQTLDVYVPRRQPWRLFVYTRECDVGTLGDAYSATGAVTPCPYQVEIAPADDVPGYVADHFRSPLAARGVHRSNSRLAGSTCPPANARGCYQVTYEVSVVGRR